MKTLGESKEKSWIWPLLCQAGGSCEKERNEKKSRGEDGLPRGVHGGFVKAYSRHQPV